VSSAHADAAPLLDVRRVLGRHRRRQMRRCCGPGRWAPHPATARDNMVAAGRPAKMETRVIYDFLIDAYETERIKVLSVWSEFADEDLPVRPRDGDPRGRSVLEHLVHQVVSEDAWFRTMLGIDLGEPPLPAAETRRAFIQRYADASARRLALLRAQDERWWAAPTQFFDVERSRAWVMVRRLTHTSHHRGQQMAMLRMLGRDLHSNYGPTADTGGLMQNHAPTIYAYAGVADLLAADDDHIAKAPLPGSQGIPVSERPDPR
jgi:uncharacterized damage-inducible protein DinB